MHIKQVFDIASFIFASTIEILIEFSNKVAFRILSFVLEMMSESLIIQAKFDMCILIHIKYLEFYKSIFSFFGTSILQLDTEPLWPILMMRTLQ